MNIDAETLNIVRAEAGAIVKKFMRAEAMAASKRNSQELADQFNKIHAEDAAAFDKLAMAVNRLNVMTDVILDLLVDDAPLRAEGRPEDKRAKFHRLCEAKAKSYNVEIKQ